MLNSERTKLENKIKDYVLKMLQDAKSGDYALNCRNQAFGVVFFACNELFDTYNNKLADWWDKEILPQFNEIIRGAKKCI